MPNQIAAGTFAFAIIPGEHQSKFIFACSSALRGANSL